MNVDAWVYQGRGADEAETKKRRPAAKVANRLRPHLARWRAIDRRRSADLRAAGIMPDLEEIRFVVNRTHDGQPLSGKIRTAWDGILEDAHLGEDVVRHSLRHTAATWLMQIGTDRWEAAGWLGMTLEQLENGYGPITRIFRKRQRKRSAVVAVVKSLQKLLCKHTERRCTVQWQLEHRRDRP